MLINAPFGKEKKNGEQIAEKKKSVDSKINRLLWLEMLLDYWLKMKNLCICWGKKGLYRFTCVLDTLRDGKLTQEWCREGEGRRRRR